MLSGGLYTFYLLINFVNTYQSIKNKNQQHSLLSMQSTSSQNSFLQKSLKEKMVLLISEAITQVSNLASEFTNFRADNKTWKEYWRPQTMKYVSTRYQFDFSNSLESSDMDKKLKLILTNLRLLQQDMATVDSQKLNQQIDKLITQLKACRQCLKKYRTNYSSKNSVSKSAQIADSYEETLKYLQQLNINFEKIYDKLIITKYTLRQAPQNQLDGIFEDLKKQLNSSCQKYPNLNSRHQDYQAFFNGITLLEKRIKLTLSQGKDQKYSIQKADEQLKILKAKLVSLQSKMNETKLSPNSITPKQQFAIGVSQHINSVHKLLQKIEKRLKMLSKRDILLVEEKQLVKTPSKDNRATLSHVFSSPKLTIQAKYLNYNSLKKASSEIYLDREEIKIAQTSGGIKSDDNKSLEQIAAKVLEIVSSTDKSLSAIMPEATENQNRTDSIPLNYEKMLLIQQQTNEVAKLAFELFERVQSQTKYLSKRKISSSSNQVTQNIKQVSYSQEKISKIVADNQQQMRKLNLTLEKLKQNLDNQQSKHQKLIQQKDKQIQDLLLQNQKQGNDIVNYQVQLEVHLDLANSSTKQILQKHKLVQDKLQDENKNLKAQSQSIENSQIQQKTIRQNQSINTPSLNNELQTQIFKLTQENKDLKQKLAMTQQQLEGEVAKHLQKSRSQSLQSQLKKEKNHNSMIHDHQSVKSQIMAKEKDDWQELSVDSLQNNKNQLISKIQSLIKQREGLELQVGNQKSQLTSLTSQVGEKKNDLKKEENNQLMAINNQQKDQNVILQSKNQELSLQHKQLQSLYKDIQYQLKLLQNSFNLKQTQSNELSSNCSKLSAQIKQHQRTLQSLKQNIKREQGVHQSIKQASLKFTQLNQQLQSKQNQLSSQQMELSKITQQIKQKTELSIRADYEILGLFKTIDIKLLSNQAKQTIQNSYNITKDTKKIKAQKNLVEQYEIQQKQLEAQANKIYSELKYMSPNTVTCNDSQRLFSNIHEEKTVQETVPSAKLKNEFGIFRSYILVCCQQIQQHLKILKIRQQIMIDDERALSAKIDFAKNQLQTANNENYINKKSLSLLKEELQRLMTQKQELVKSVQSIRRNHENTISTYGSNIIEVSEVTTKYRQSKKRIQQLNQNITTLENKKSQLSDKIVKIQANLQRMTSDYISKEKELDDLKSKYDQLLITNQRQSHFQTDKDKLQAELNQLLDEFKPLDDRTPRKTQQSPTNQSIFVLRSMLQERDAAIAKYVKALSQFNDFKIQSEAVYNEKTKQLQQKTSQFVKKISQDFRQINKTISEERSRIWNQKQIINQRVQCMNSCMKQIFLASSRYLKNKSFSKILDAQLQKSISDSVQYELSFKDLQAILSSVICVIYESETQLGQANGLVKLYDDKLVQLSHLFAQSASVQDLKTQVQAKIQSGNIQAISKLKKAVAKFALQSSQQITKQIDAVLSSVNKSKDEYVQDVQKLSNQQKQLKKYYEQLLAKQKQEKDIQIAHLKDSFYQQIEIQKAMVSSANTQLEKLQADYKSLEKKIKQNVTSNENLMARISQYSLKTFEIQKEKEKLQTKQSELTSQIQELQDSKAVLEKTVREVKEELKTVKINLYNAQKLADQKQNTITQLDNKISQLERKIQSLNNDKDSLTSASSELFRFKQSLAQTKRQLEGQRAITNKQKLELLQYAQIKQAKDLLEARVSQLLRGNEDIKSKHSQTINSLESQNSTLLSQKNKLTSDLEYSQHVLREIEHTLRQKLNLNQQIQPQNLAEVITNFNPSSPVGCKLITSVIIHGYDDQRSQILKKIEQFTSRKIKRSDIQGRFPETKSLMTCLPKVDSPFIMLFKAYSGKVFGAYSDGLKGKTFFFAFWTEEEDRFGNIVKESSAVKEFIPEKPSLSVSPVELVSGKYLIFGKDELKINMMDLGTIVANSDVAGEKHYKNFQWSQIAGEKKEEAISLERAEMHRVEFE